MQVHYLEIVTNEVDTTCASLEKLHEVAFNEPAPELGHARTAQFENGGMMGVRAPMHETEQPVVRSYLRVSNIDAAMTTVVANGAEIAHPPLEIPGLGQFAIYIQGGLHHGLWQV